MLWAEGVTLDVAGFEVLTGGGGLLELVSPYDKHW